VKAVGTAFLRDVLNVQVSVAAKRLDRLIDESLGLRAFPDRRESPSATQARRLSEGCASNNTMVRRCFMVPSG